MRVFGCGSNKRNSAVLHIFKKCLLLLLIKILNFINVKKNSAKPENVVGLCNNILNVRKCCACRINSIKIHARLLCNNTCRGCFARSGRAKENHIAHSSLVHHLAQNTALTEQMGLSNYIVKALRTQNIRQNFIFVCHNITSHTQLLYQICRNLSIYQMQPFLPFIEG